MSSSTQDIIPQLDLGNTYGALFIGAILAAMLFGVTNIQAFIYFQTHRGTGKTFYKLAVILLWILDALHLALIVHGIYYTLVTNYGNIAVLPVLVWSAKLQIPVDMLIIWGVHFLYVHRIWIVSKGRSRVLPITVGILVVLGSGVAISLVWGISQVQLFADLIKLAWATYSTLGTICFLDVLIASSLCYLLATSRTGFSRQGAVLSLRGSDVLTTGCVTRYSSSTSLHILTYISYSVFSLTAIITCAVMPNNFVFLGVEFLMVKLYVNSYIALLNSRYYLQVNAHNIDPSEFHNCHGVNSAELRICASQDKNFPAPRKPGQNWRLYELMAYNISIVKQDEDAFFGGPLPAYTGPAGFVQYEKYVQGLDAPSHALIKRLDLAMYGAGGKYDVGAFNAEIYEHWVMRRRRRS
ncbi:hypothetical protein DFH29DRAFT_1074883 [Suillus ampliporus]|nr:hypothetical protein DFH29DRAFT_1074883 [Suillus ampliporus]